MLYFLIIGGCGVEGENDSWDFGTGAGFYINASREPWSKNYRMYSYITEELPVLIANNFPVNPLKQSIMGHRFVISRIYVMMTLKL